MQHNPKLPPPVTEREDQQDYFIDMISQLADQARALGDLEVAIHLDATARARRHALGLRTRRSAIRTFVDHSPL